MSKNLFAFVVLNWNSYFDTVNCIHSIKRLKYDNVLIIVVDNNSIDLSGEKIRREFDDVLYIGLFENFGYTGGNNVGIKKALEMNADYIMVINSDTLVDNVDFVDNVIRVFALDSNISAVGPVIYDSENNERMDSYSDSFFLRCLEKHVSDVSLLNIPFDKVQNVNRISGCAIVFRAQLIRHVPLFDESFFMYCEEMDLCYRLKENDTYLLKVNDPDLAVVKRRNEDRRHKVYVWYYTTRNYFHLIDKHSAGYKNYFLKFLMLISVIKRTISIRSLRVSFFMLRGMRDGLFDVRGKVDF